MNNKLIHGSLFSGIGGFDLAAEWIGWINAFHCELNKFGRKVLKYYWGNAKSYEDITKTDFTIWRGRINVLTGGFPCQPYSLAGQRKGKDDERHLWPEMFRAIREIQPSYIVGENVYGIVNWNRGLVFSEVQTDLEGEGYEVWPVILPACAVNAPHRRDRVWFIAYSNRKSEQQYSGYCRQEWEKTKKNQSEVVRQENRAFSTKGLKRNKESRIITDTNSSRWFQNNIKQWSKKFKPVSTGWERFPTQSPVCSRNDGISTKLDGITFPKWRNESIKAYGNSIVPQVAYEIFKVIQIADKQMRKNTT